jgi:hypothetical protein
MIGSQKKKPRLNHNNSINTRTVHLKRLPWPLRPWIWAALCSGGAFTVNRLVDAGGDIAIWRQVTATFVMIAILVFVLTAELRRIAWALAFAGGAGAVMAFVGWFTAAYNQGGGIAEYPFLAGLFALLIAAPLFSDRARRRGLAFPLYAAARSCMDRCRHRRVVAGVYGRLVPAGLSDRAIV